MSVRKVKGLESDFTIVPNKAINDKLSWAARGMLLYLCSKSEGWEVCISDLVNQTTGSKKKSGRDSVRAIMSELIECGYMRKSQHRNILGQFNNSDHEVSFTPFTENPYTVNATQESKDLTKKRKDLNTDHSLKTEEFFIKQLNKNEFIHCHEMIRLMEWEINNTSIMFHVGKMTFEEWTECERNMASCDFFDHAGFIDWWKERHYSSMRKVPSLKNMVCEMNGKPFEQLYSAAMQVL